MALRPGMSGYRLVAAHAIASEDCQRQAYPPAFKVYAFLTSSAVDLVRKPAVDLTQVLPL